MITAATLCSGIGAPEAAMPGWRWLWCAEREPFPAAVLAARFGHPNLGDITAPDFVARAIAAGLPRVIVAGTPCQAFSIAGKRKGLDDDRGNLTLVFVRIVHALADAARALRQPAPAILWENVPGIFGQRDNPFGCFVAALVGADAALAPPGGRRWPRAGMVSGPKGRVAWRVLSAQYFGLAQRRERVFAVVDLGDGPDPAAVLFERARGEGDFAPRRKTREKPAAGIAGPSGRAGIWQAVAAAFAHPRFGVPDIAGTLTAKTKSGHPDIAGGAFDQFIPELAWALQERDAKGADSNTKQGHLIPVALQPLPFDTTQITHPANRSRPKPGDACHALAAGAHVPAIAIQERATSENISAGPDGAGYSIDLAYTLEARQTPQAIAMNLRGREGGNMPELDDLASLRAASGGSSRSFVAFHGTQDPDVTGDISPPLGTNHGQECGLANGWAVRRLTPVECARLQGFPDGHTRIAWRGKPDDQCPDGPQYKGYGNAMAVNVVRWIMTRMDAAIADGVISEAA